MTERSKIIASLEQIARAAKEAKDIEEIGAAIRLARQSIKDEKAALPELDNELSVWQTKLPLIFKEPVGRQGMAKHALHWVERLKKDAAN